MLASSRDGEEHLLLAALQTLPASQQHLLHSLQWLVVPRHPQRFESVAHLFAAAGWQVRRRSTAANAGNALPTAPPASICNNTGNNTNNSAPVLWLGDSMGEMPLYYGMADIVLMGGSFAPLGGQNLIEACACGCPVLLGPHTFNFAQASAQAIAAGAALRCADITQAIAQAGSLLLPASTQPAAPNVCNLPAMQQAANAFSQLHRGAAARIVADLQRRGWL